MTLSAELIEDISEAFDSELSDAVATYSFERVTGAYSTASGGNVLTPFETDSVRGIAITFTKREIEHSDGSIREGDLRLLCLASEVSLTGGIKIDDRILNGPGGLNYRVLTSPLDPTNTVYMAHLRVYQ